MPDDHLGPTERALYLTAALTGLRQGELFALRWRDIDWTAMRIRVRRSYARKRAGREAQFGRPKSKRSSRSVPMHDRVGAELERHFQRSATTRPTTISSSATRTPEGRSTPPTCSPRFKDALDAAGRPAAPLPRSAPHLRHADGGGRGADAHPQEWLGHRDIKTTMIYADYQASDQEHELVERRSRGHQFWPQSERN